MLAIMKGGSGRWHIFRGKETREFFNGLVMVAAWPVNVKLNGHERERAALYLTDRGACVLIVNNDNIPDVVAQGLFKKAVAAAEESERKKSAAN